MGRNAGEVYVSTPFPQRVTRWAFVVCERAGWGREEVTVEEVREGFGLDAPQWQISHHGQWDRATGMFIRPRGEEQWAAIRYDSPEEALAEAPRACAAALTRYAKRLAEYDAEQAAGHGVGVL